MTETNEIETLKAEIAELRKLITLQDKPSTVSNENILELVKEIVDTQSKKPRKTKWRDRYLTLFPNGDKRYLTKKELHAKETVDNLIETEEISKLASNNALERFLGNPKIRSLDRASAFWAKQYYKQVYLSGAGDKKAPEHLHQRGVRS